MSEYAMLAAGYRTEIAALTGPLVLRSVGADGAAELGRHRQFCPEPAPVPADELVTSTQWARITGRGGAEFPFWRKLRSALDAGRRQEIVVNGSEGEPAWPGSRPGWAPEWSPAAARTSTRTVPPGWCCRC